MGKPARIGLLLGAASCLLAVMVDWIIGQLRTSPTVYARPVKHLDVADPQSTQDCA